MLRGAITMEVLWSVIAKNLYFVYYFKRSSKEAIPPSFQNFIF